MKKNCSYEVRPYGEVGGNFFDYKKAHIFSLIDEQYAPQTVKEIRKRGVEQIYDICKGFLIAKYPFRLVMKVLSKKTQMLLMAATEREVKEILKISTCQFKGDFVITGKYHVPEEELLVWLEVSKRGQLIPQAQKRFVELYETFYLGEDNIAEEDDDGWE